MVKRRSLIVCLKVPMMLYEYQTHWVKWLAWQNGGTKLLTIKEDEIAQITPLKILGRRMAKQKSCGHRGFNLVSEQVSR